MDINATTTITRDEIETLIKQYVYEKTGYGVGKITYTLGSRRAGMNEYEPDGIVSATIALEVQTRPLVKTEFPKAERGREGYVWGPDR